MDFLYFPCLSDPIWIFLLYYLALTFTQHPQFLSTALFQQPYPSKLPLLHKCYSLTVSLHLDWLSGVRKDHITLPHWCLLKLLVSSPQLDLQSYIWNSSSLSNLSLVSWLLLLFSSMIIPDLQIKYLIQLPNAYILASYMFEKIKAIRQWQLTAELPV